MNYYKGLTHSEIEQSRLKHGANVLTPPKKKSWVKLLLEKFNDPLIKILLVAAVVSVAVGLFSPEGGLVESVGIIAAIILATFISFLNEYKAGKEFDILNKINDTTLVKVIRVLADGTSGVTQVPKNEIVVDDYVVITAGDELPADGVLQECIGLKINESSLNGESKPSSKQAEKSDSYDTAYSPNNVYRGTTVSEGDGIFKVTAVGDSTEIGKTARQASEVTEVETPLNKQLNRLGKLIGKVGIWLAAATFLTLFARDLINGSLTLEFTASNVAKVVTFFMVAVTLIVMAVPEGLPMSITLSLAYSMRKMTAENTLVRKMHACETMGAATVICTDKTGTLTFNKMSVYYCSAPATEEFAYAIAGNSTAFLEGNEIIGNPTEGALLNHIKGLGFNYLELREKIKVLKRIPFTSQTKFMATIVELPGGERKLYLKGAPETLLSKCAQDCNGLKINALEELKKIGEYQRKGMRSLSFAHCDITEASNDMAPSEVVDIEKIMESGRLVYDGFASIQDPIRESVPAAMGACERAGIAVKIVTGDTILTAIEIARQSGLWKEGDTMERNAITGPDFEKLSDTEALARAKELKVMARSRPADKMRLVKLLQGSGEVVAVTGDGTNDAPALNYADVGLAMGSGTAVAKESSDIILLNDSFASVVSAVQWGRSIYLNIQKFIYFQLTVNVAALLMAFVGPLVGIEFPLTVTQILWVNLIMDTLAAIALATEPSDKEVMNAQPRDTKAFIITRNMWRGIFGYGLGFFVINMALLFYYKMFDGEPGDLTVRQLTVFFTLFVFMQLWNLFNAKALGTRHTAFHRFFGNRAFLFIAALILVLQIVIVEVGGEAMRAVPLSAGAILLIFSLSSLVAIVPQSVLYLSKRPRRNKS